MENGYCQVLPGSALVPFGFVFDWYKLPGTAMPRISTQAPALHPRSKDVEAKLAAAVRARQCLVLGQHVVEVDCWGMDCYTRRNIFDGGWPGRGHKGNSILWYRKGYPKRATPRGHAGSPPVAELRHGLPPLATLCG